MELEKFKELLESNGSNLDLWDDALSTDAKKLMDDSSEAKALYDEVLKLDNMLDQFEAPEPDSALKEKILSKIPNQEKVESPQKVVPIRPVHVETPIWKKMLLPSLVPVAAAAAIAFFFISTEENMEDVIDFPTELASEQDVDDFLEAVLIEEAEELEIYELL